MLSCYDFWTRNCEDLHWVKLWDFFFKANVRKTLFSSWMRPGGTGKRLSPVQVTGWKGRLRPAPLGGSCQNRGLPTGSHLRRWAPRPLGPEPRPAAARPAARTCAAPAPPRPWRRAVVRATGRAKIDASGRQSTLCFWSPPPRGEAATGASSQERCRSDKNYPSQHAVPGAGGSTAWWGL